MAAEKKSDFWICFLLLIIACVLANIGKDLDEIVKVIHEHAGEP